MSFEIAANASAVHFQNELNVAPQSNVRKKEKHFPSSLQLPTWFSNSTGLEGGSVRGHERLKVFTHKIF